MTKIARKYRNDGARGALLDEYERALGDLITVISPLSSEALEKVVDHETKDKDCQSIQTILSHVVGAGYTYAISVRKYLGENVEYREKILLPTSQDYINALKDMFQYNIELFEDHSNLKLEEYDSEKKILVRWGQRYDVEQLYEHAIVHILRHRRQIERFIIRLEA